MHRGMQIWQLLSQVNQTLNTIQDIRFVNQINYVRIIKNHKCIMYNKNEHVRFSE